MAKQKLIGIYSFSLENIYQRKDNAILHQWVALIDNSADSVDCSVITGYMKLSIQVTGPKDPPIEIAVEEEGAKPKKILIPIQVNPRYL